MCLPINSYITSKHAKTLGVAGGCVSLGSWFWLWVPGARLIFSNKVRRYLVFRFSSIVLAPETIPSYTIESPFSSFAVIKYPFHGGVFLDSIIFTPSSSAAPSSDYLLSALLPVASGIISVVPRYFAASYSFVVSLNWFSVVRAF